MRVKLYGYRDAISAPPRLLIAGEKSDSYASVGLILWHLNFGIVIVKVRKCHCGGTVELFNQCNPCNKRKEMGQCK